MAAGGQQRKAHRNSLLLPISAGGHAARSLGLQVHYPLLLHQRA
jgi:hypothetical protein